ncbi:MAG: acyl carrier protein [Bacteroidales bacterium]|jgi:acyl carrier protein|nr:acyl carrier protein [Bacteroidales bacterium]
MDIKKFIENFAFQFDETDSSLFDAETEFKTLDEWSSFVALTIIAMVDEEYGVQIKGDDIRNSKTIQDLFDLVESRK